MRLFRRSRSGPASSSSDLHNGGVGGTAADPQLTGLQRSSELDNNDGDGVSLAETLTEDGNLSVAGESVLSGGGVNGGGSLAGTPKSIKKGGKRSHGGSGTKFPNSCL